MSTSDTKTQRWRQSTWRISLILDMRDLVPPAVQWAKFAEDPRPRFRSELEGRRDFNQRRLNEAEEPHQKHNVRRVQMGLGWDRLFKDITGDNVHLLTACPGASHILSSNEAIGETWIATKVVEVHARPICWCLHVEVTAHVVPGVKTPRSARRNSTATTFIR